MWQGIFGTRKPTCAGEKTGPPLVKTPKITVLTHAPALGGGSTHPFGKGTNTIKNGFMGNRQVLMLSRGGALDGDMHVGDVVQGGHGGENNPLSGRTEPKPHEQREKGWVQERKGCSAAGERRPHSKKWGRRRLKRVDSKSGVGGRSRGGGGTRAVLWVRKGEGEEE